MPQPRQKNIEQYLEEHNIDDEELKAKFLQKISKTIHDRNDLVIEYEKADEDYRKEQILSDIQELDQKIEKDLEEFIKNNN